MKLIVPGQWREQIDNRTVKAIAGWDFGKLSWRLLYAARLGDLTTVRLAYDSAAAPMLSRPADLMNCYLPYTSDRQCRSLEVEMLCCAVQSNHDDLALFLLAKGADHEGKFPQERHANFSRGHTPMFTHCYTFCLCTTIWSTPLAISASWSRGVQFLEFLLSKGADVNSRESNGRETALHGALRATAREHNDMPNTLAKIRLLLDHAADPGLADTNGESALHCAVRQGLYDVLAMFLERGANIEERFEDETPLMRACVLRHSDIVRLLLSKGAQVDAAHHVSPRFTALELTFLGSPGRQRLATSQEICQTRTILRMLCGRGYPQLPCMAWTVMERVFAAETEAGSVHEFSQLSFVQHSFRGSFVMDVDYFTRDTDRSLVISDVIAGFQMWSPLEPSSCESHALSELYRLRSHLVKEGLLRHTAGHYLQRC